MKRHEMTEGQWERVKDFLPPERKPQGGRPAKDNRVMLNGIIYWLATGVPWRDLPERFGPWQSVYGRFRTWTLQGIWDKILIALIEMDIVDESTLMLDSTTIKVHQHASGSKKGNMKKKLGVLGED
jgi:transposase